MKNCFGLIFTSTLMTLTVGAMQVYIPFPTKEVGLGHSVIIPCRARGGPPDVTLSWLGPSGTLLEASPRIQLQRSSSPARLSLLLYQAQNSDSGVYRCVARSQSTGEQAEAQLMMTVSQTLEFLSAPPVQEFVLGSRATLQCRVRGGSDLVVVWSKGGQEIVNSARVFQDQDHHSLTLLSLRLDDAGVYRCEATVESRGELSYRDISLVVLVPPRVSVSPREMNTTSGTGQTVTLVCRIEAGSPAPIITWSRGDSPLPAGSARVSVSPDGSTLSLYGVVRGDQGLYVCLARNTAGTDTQSVTLRVYEPPQVLWVEAPTLREGGDAELRCGARGDPPPTITWMGPLHYDEKTSTHHTMDGDEVNASLVLTRVRAAHAGDYSCIATNDLNSTFRIVHLAVLFSPISLDPQFHPFYSWISNPVNLTCEFEAFPAPSVTWARGGTRPWGAPPPLGVTRSVTLSPSHVVSYLEVDAQSEDDFGLYSCTAVNPHGRLQQRVHLHMAECPGVPVSLRVLESHHHEVHVAFEPPAWDGGVPLVATAARWRGLGRPPITGARGDPADPKVVGGVSQGEAGSRGVGSQGSQGSQRSSWGQQQQEEDQVWSTRSFNSTETLLIITGLESNSSYELRLAMVNSVCWGNYSNPVLFTTRAEQVAPSAPIISQRPGEPHVVSLSVEDDGGLPVTGYTVRYRPVSQDGATAVGPWREVRGGPRGEVLLVGLQALTRYQAEAYAENAEGRSSGSEFVFLSPEERPKFRNSRQWLWLLLLAPALLLVADVSCCASRRRGVTAHVGRSLCRGRGDSGQRDKVANSLFVGRDGVAEKSSEPLANIELDVAACALPTDDVGMDRERQSTPSPPPSPPTPSTPSPSTSPPSLSPSLSPAPPSPKQPPTFSSFQ